MRLARPVCWALACLFALPAAAATESDRTQYERRSAERFAALFRTLDRNVDRAVTREEAQGDLNFMPHFEDIDINRDGTVELAELERYVSRTYSTALPMQ